MLYVVPTPIGNLEDISFRAVKVLEQVNMVLAEDTRTSSKLFKHYGIITPLRPFHSFNEHKVLSSIVEMLSTGMDIAVISDAGTPGISDPAFLLVRAARESGIKVTVLPGATAFVPALVASGLPCGRFHFEGFLPHKKGRQTRLKYLANLEETFIIYESPHRLLRCLKELIKHCGGQRRASVAREISKIHEEFRTDTLENLFNHFEQSGTDKGEIVIVVSGV